MFRRGDVVYFKQGRKGSHRKAPTATFKGHGFGVFLGHLPPYEKDLEPAELVMQMGAIGFLTFDDVADFLGEDAAKKCVASYEAKYYPNNAQPAVTDEEGKKLIIDGPPKRQLLGADGKPITPLMTAQDIAEKIKAMGPDQIRAAIENAKKQIPVKAMTPELEKQIEEKTCEALGVPVPPKESIGLTPFPLGKLGKLTEEAEK